jgi:hypothetical protein
MIKTILAIVGGGVIFLAIMGSFGVGNFVLLYGPNKITCTEAESK